MRGIIFAAGMAQRLGELTKELPKCCLPINQFETILARNLSLMSKYGFEEIIIVTGHAEEKIKKEVRSFTEQIQDIKLVHNEFYKDRNNIYTAYLVRNLINENTLIFNSDIVFDEKILAKAVEEMKSNKDSFMIIDNHKRLVDEDMKVLLDESRRIIRINKHLDNEKSFGEYIGILRLSQHDVEAFANSLEHMIYEEIYHKYYEDALDRIATELTLRVISTDGHEWTEIDFVEDYEKAKNLECVKLQYQNN